MILPCSTEQSHNSHVGYACLRNNEKRVAGGMAISIVTADLPDFSLLVSILTHLALLSGLTLLLKSSHCKLQCVGGGRMCGTTEGGFGSGKLKKVFCILEGCASNSIWTWHVFILSEYINCGDPS